MEKKIDEVNVEEANIWGIDVPFVLSFFYVGDVLSLILRNAKPMRQSGNLLCNNGY